MCATVPKVSYFSNKAIFTVFDVLYSIHVKFLYNPTILVELFILVVKLFVTKLLNSLSFLNSLNFFFLRWQEKQFTLTFLPPTTYKSFIFQTWAIFLVNEVNGFIMLCNSQCAIYIIRAEDDIEYSWYAWILNIEKQLDGKNRNINKSNETLRKMFARQYINFKKVARGKFYQIFLQ